ncbi:MAG: glycosyltransferase 87 family protein [Solirubrobacteraceae bacterium]
MALIGGAILVAIVAWWTWRALHDPRAWDFQPAYRAGQGAWTTGHPERLTLWDGTPLLAAIMAVVSRLMTLRTGAELMTVLNLVLVVGLVGVVLRRLQGQIAPRWCWLTAFALLSFGPVMSTVWWKQFNIIALTLSMGGFELLRHKRLRSASGLIGLSVAIKPLFVLLPFVLLARRETRRVGAMALAWVVVPNIAGQALMAARAHDLGVMDPVRVIQNFDHKAGPTYGAACKSLNFAPGSLLCRLMGDQNWFLQRVVVFLAVAVLGAWVIDALRGRAATSWEMLAFSSPLAVMLSPLDWAHYQVLLVPLFVLLLVRFVREGAGLGAWVGLAAAFVLCSLIWEPYGTLPGAVRALVSSHRETGYDLRSIDSVAQFAQYVLVITGLLWYAQARGGRSGSAARE